MAKTRFVKRRKSRFKTARAAWNDIARRIGLRPRRVRPAHTARVWRWRVMR